MKRSEINQSIKEAMMFFTSQQFYLPQWAYFSPLQWKDAGKEFKEISSNCLGWDITDFGKGNFTKEGLILFTLRNGSYSNPTFSKEYCEKIMMVKLRQNIPMHFHRTKMEDLINRGGGDLVIELWKSDKNGELLSEELTLQMDGVTRTIAGGDMITLTPGESLTLEPFVYHRFWAEKETALVGIISKVNNDADENRYLEPLGRHQDIEEDEAPVYLLCQEYPK
jgi:D-lyxose ketol-isomerase